MQKKDAMGQSLVLGLMILAAAFSRLIPHLPNFTAVVAMGLLAGAHFQNRRIAVLVPLVALFLSDLLIGFHDGMIWVYASMALISLASLFFLNAQSRWLRLGLVSLSSSIIFFVLTNLGVWLQSGMYPRTGAGLIDCYLMALPFLGNQVVGDLFYSGVLFASYSWLRSFQWGKTA